MSGEGRSRQMSWQQARQQASPGSLRHRAVPTAARASHHPSPLPWPLTPELPCHTYLFQHTRPSVPNALPCATPMPFPHLPPSPPPPAAARPCPAAWRRWPSTTRVRALQPVVLRPPAPVPVLGLLLLPARVRARRPGAPLAALAPLRWGGRRGEQQTPEAGRAG